MTGLSLSCGDPLCDPFYNGLESLAERRYDREFGNLQIRNFTYFGSCATACLSDLLPALAVDAADTAAEIPARPARKAGERTAIINRDIVEVRSVSEIAVNRSELAIAGSSEMAGGVNHASQSGR